MVTWGLFNLLLLLGFQGLSLQTRVSERQEMGLSLNKLQFLGAGWSIWHLEEHDRSRGGFLPAEPTCADLL